MGQVEEDWLVSCRLTRGNHYPLSPGSWLGYILHSIRFVHTKYHPGSTCSVVQHARRAPRGTFVAVAKQQDRC
jgi:hypothetical protein